MHLNSTIINESSENITDLDNIASLCRKNLNNPKIGYININHLRNKIVELRPIIQDIDFTFLAVAETKINCSFHSTQFQIDGYYCPSEFRRDRTYNNGGGMLLYIKKGTPCKRLNKFEHEDIETIVVELNIDSKKWCVISIYRNEDIDTQIFLNQLSISLDQILNSYENIIILGDINVNSLDKNSTKFKHLKAFCDSFDLTNLIKVPTCFQSDNPTSIDVILTNKNRSFMHTKSILNGLSDWHSIIFTMLRKQIKRLTPVEISYRCYTNFNEQSFLSELDQGLSNIDFSLDTNTFPHFIREFEHILDKHAPMKKKLIRGNNAPYVTKELRKEIRYRSRLKNIARKERTTNSKIAFKKQRNKCTKIRRDNIRSYFENVTNKGTNSKQFWKSILPYLSNKGSHGNEDYILEEDNELIKYPEQVGGIFCDYYTNIVEHATGIPPVHIPPSEHEDLIESILSHYENHESILAIRNMGILQKFTLSSVEESVIEQIINKLDASKATGIDNISARLVKLSSKVIKKPLTQILNNCIKNAKFPDDMKFGKITPLYKPPKQGKKGSRLDKKCYRPVSVLTTFSKIFERYVLNEILDHVNTILSDKISAYRKGYSCQHVLLKLTEEWRKHLDQNKIVGAVLMDLSKAFDCLPHELLIAKLSAYGFDKNTLTFFLSYLKGRKQTVNIKGKLSIFMDILAGVPQGSILGPILFNIFINDIINIFDICDINNFADDNTLSAMANNIPKLIDYLEKDTQKAIDWFQCNHMIANPDKFEAIIIEKNGRDTSGIPLNINNDTITSSKEVTLLGITIDNKLSFNTHISNICKNAANQLNAIKRLQTHFSMQTKREMAQTFALCHFNYCPLVWHFCGNANIHKMEKIQERTLRFILDDYTSNYDDILEKSGKSTLYLNRVRIMAQEVYKSINDLSPKYTKEILSNRFSKYPTRRPLDLYVPKVNQVKFGYRSYTFEAPSVWNTLPLEIRKADNYKLFKKLISSWTGPTCRCNFCNVSE